MQKQALPKGPQAWTVIQESSEDPAVSFLCSKPQPRTKGTVSIQNKELSPCGLELQASPEHNSPVKPDTHQYSPSVRDTKVTPYSYPLPTLLAKQAALSSSLWLGTRAAVYPKQPLANPIVPGLAAHWRGLRAGAEPRPLPLHSASSLPEA